MRDGRVINLSHEKKKINFNPVKEIIEVGLSNHCSYHTALTKKQTLFYFFFLSDCVIKNLDINNHQTNIKICHLRSH